MKKLLFVLALLCPGILAAQTPGRVEIRGHIKVSEGSESEGITIFNKNSGKGSVSTETGFFEIKAKAGDSLYFSALQFEELFVVVTDKNIIERSVDVEIHQGVNELAEVVIRPHNLSGNLLGDVKMIPTMDLNLPVYSAAEINDIHYQWSQDSPSAVTNAAISSGRLKNGVNILAVVGAVVDLVLPPIKIKPKDTPVDRSSYQVISLEKELRKRYSDAFFKDHFNIPPERISSFIWFAENNGFQIDYLDPQKELNLLEFLMKQSKMFQSSRPG